MKFLLTAALILISSLTGAAPPAHRLSETKVSEHFVYHYNNIDARYAGQLLTLSEGFLSFIKDNYFNPKFEYPITALVFSSKQDFQHYLKHDLHIKNPPNFGIYIKEYKLFATFRGSGIGTFTHEIMHPLVEENLPSRPEWAVEGIPGFFEKFFGYWEGNKLQLQLGYQNPWRVHQLGDEITNLDLKKIITLKRRNYAKASNSELRMVSVFIDRQGLFEKYLALVNANDKKGYRFFIEAAFEKPIEDIIPLWRAYLEDVSRNKASIYKIPGSAILGSKEEFETLKAKLYLQKPL
ncbi:MAG: hypothetical protein KBT88_01795 [Gammaproteobacteria bacterium]|nr:hypothetical protein [Gammaproteobacteria bacterium]MBQ0838490.1 hypothetical protein [Gammaproteobacteria bacterium]